MMNGICIGPHGCEACLLLFLVLLNAGMKRSRSKVSRCVRRHPAICQRHGQPITPLPVPPIIRVLQCDRRHHISPSSTLLLPHALLPTHPPILPPTRPTSLPSPAQTSLPPAHSVPGTTLNASPSPPPPHDYSPPPPTDPRQHHVLTNPRRSTHLGLLRAALNRLGVAIEAGPDRRRLGLVTGLLVRGPVEAAQSQTK